MTPGPGGHSNQPVSAFFDRFMCKHIVDYVVQDNSAVRMHSLIHILACSQRSDHNRRLITDAQLQVMRQPVIGFVHDQVNCEWRRRICVMSQLVTNPAQPHFQLLDRSRIQ